VRCWRRPSRFSASTLVFFCRKTISQEHGTSRRAARGSGFTRGFVFARLEAVAVRIPTEEVPMFFINSSSAYRPYASNNVFDDTFCFSVLSSNRISSSPLSLMRAVRFSNSSSADFDFIAHVHVILVTAYPSIYIARRVSIIILNLILRAFSRQIPESSGRFASPYGQSKFCRSPERVCFFVKLVEILRILDAS